MELCFICKETVTVFKYYNLKRYCMQKLAAKFNAYQGMLCKNTIEELKKKVCHFNKIFFKKAKWTTAAATAWKTEISPTEKPREEETCRWEVSSKEKKPRRDGKIVLKGTEFSLGSIC